MKFTPVEVNWFSMLDIVVPATRGEYQRIKQQLEMERIPPVNPGEPPRVFHEIPREEQAAMEKKRLSGKLLMTLV